MKIAHARDNRDLKKPDRRTAVRKAVDQHFKDEIDELNHEMRESMEFEFRGDCNDLLSHYASDNRYDNPELYITADDADLNHSRFDEDDGWGWESSFPDTRVA